MERKDVNQSMTQATKKHVCIDVAFMGPCQYFLLRFRAAQRSNTAPDAPDHAVLYTLNNNIVALAMLKRNKVSEVALTELQNKTENSQLD